MVGIAGAVSNTWYLSSDSSGTYEYVMYKDSPSGGTSNVPIPKSTDPNPVRTWTANEAAEVSLTFPAGSWSGILRIYAADKQALTCNVDIGVWTGSSFTSHGSASCNAAEDVTTDCPFTIPDASQIDIPAGQWLALQASNPSTAKTLDVIPDGTSYVSSPTTDPGYPVPELPSLILFSAGLITFFSYVLLIKRRGEKGK